MIIFKSNWQVLRGGKSVRSFTSVVLSIVIFVLAGSVFAGEFDGRFSSRVYWYETNDTGHVRIYESLRSGLSLLNKPDGRSLGFHSYFRWRTDLDNKSASDPQTYIYNAYFRLRNIPQGSRIDLGRQFIYSPLVSTVIDGLRFKYTILNKTDLELFGGSTADQLDPETVRSFSDYLTAGGRLNTKYKRLNLGLSWILRKNDGEITNHLVGSDISYRYSRLNLLGKVAYNIVDVRLSEILTRGSYSLPDYYFSAEFRWREPLVRDNSIFSIIDFERYKELRFEAHRKLVGTIRLVSGFDINLYDSDNSIGGRLGLNGGSWSIAWRHRSGYGGKSNGVVGFASFKVAKDLRLYYTAGFSQYKIQELQEEYSDSYMSIAGIERRFGRDLMIRSEVQYLRNAVAENDFRINLNLTKGFKVRFGN